MDYQDHCLTQYEKEELLEIAALLGLEKSEEIEAHVLIELLRIHLLENGMTSHPLVEEFVRVLRLYDDSVTIEVDEFHIPSCFGYVSDSDPACHYCLLYLKCGEKLINEKIPQCYGQLYSPLECSSCMLQETCRVDLPQIPDVEGAYEVYVFTEEHFLSNIMRFLARYFYFRCNWPEQIIKSKFARLQGLKIGNAEVREMNDKVIKEALYFGGPKGARATERRAITFNGTRQPLTQDNAYTVRLAWRFK